MTSLRWGAGSGDKEAPLTSNRSNTPEATFVAIVCLVHTHAPHPLGSKERGPQKGRKTRPLLETLGP